MRMCLINAFNCNYFEVGELENKKNYNWYCHLRHLKTEI